MIYDKSLPARFIIFCSQHYLKLFGLSILLLCTLSLHKAILVLPHPVVIKGEIVDWKIVGRYTHSSRYGGRSTTVLKAPIIEFNYDGNQYRIVGGSDQERSLFEDTKVIFNKASPQNGLESNFEGFLDFPLCRLSFLLWLFITAILYGLVNLDKHFSVFDLSVKTLTPARGIVITFLLLLVPFIKHGALLLFGLKTEGILTNETTYINNYHHHVVTYAVDGKEYRFASEGDYYDEQSVIGLPVTIIYDPNRPEKACIDDYKIIYVNNWLVATGMGLVFLTGWFFATRMPNDEGTMDE